MDLLNDVKLSEKEILTESSLSEKENLVNLTESSLSEKENLLNLAESSLSEIRPWGFFSVLYGNDYNDIKIKKITVLPNHKLSLQSHNYRKEIWTCLKGNGLAQIDNDYIELKEHITVTINNKQKHRLINNSTIPLEIIELQIAIPSYISYKNENNNFTNPLLYLGEDDIIRYEDDYNRIN